MSQPTCIGQSSQADGGGPRLLCGISEEQLGAEMLLVSEAAIESVMRPDRGARCAAGGAAAQSSGGGGGDGGGNGGDGGDGVCGR